MDPSPRLSDLIVAGAVYSLLYLQPGVPKLIAAAASIASLR
ncbi:hypothetical protein [Streptomyces decoyicus]